MHLCASLIKRRAILPRVTHFVSAECKCFATASRMLQAWQRSSGWYTRTCHNIQECQDENVKMIWWDDDEMMMRWWVWDNEAKTSQFQNLSMRDKHRRQLTVFESLSILSEHVTYFNYAILSHLVQNRGYCQIVRNEGTIPRHLVSEGIIPEMKPNIVPWCPIVSRSCQPFWCISSLGITYHYITVEKEIECSHGSARSTWRQIPDLHLDPSKDAAESPTWERSSMEMIIKPINLLSLPLPSLPWFQPKQLQSCHHPHQNHAQCPHICLLIQLHIHVREGLRSHKDLEIGTK